MTQYNSAGPDTHHVIVDAVHHAHTTLLNLGFTQEKSGSAIWPVIEYFHPRYGRYVFEGPITAEGGKYVCREIEIGYVDPQHMNDMSAKVLDLVNIQTMTEHLLKLVKQVIDDNGGGEICSIGSTTKSPTHPTS